MATLSFTTKQLFSICCTIPFPFSVYLYTFPLLLVVEALVSCATAIDQGLPAEGLQKRKGKGKACRGKSRRRDHFLREMEEGGGNGGNVSPVLFVLRLLHEPAAALLQQHNQRAVLLHLSQSGTVVLRQSKLEIREM